MYSVFGFVGSSFTVAVGSGEIPAPSLGGRHWQKYSWTPGTYPCWWLLSRPSSHTTHPHPQDTYISFCLSVEVLPLHLRNACLQKRQRVEKGRLKDKAQAVLDVHHGLDPDSLYECCNP